MVSTAPTAPAASDKKDSPRKSKPIIDIVLKFAADQKEDVNELNAAYASATKEDKNIDHQDKDGNTALHIAAQYGLVETVKWLLNGGDKRPKADIEKYNLIDASPLYATFFRRTIPHRTIPKQTQLEILKLFLNVVNKWHFDSNKKAYLQHNIQKSKLQTLLDVTILNGNEGCVGLLLEQKITINLSAFEYFSDQLLLLTKALLSLPNPTNTSVSFRKWLELMNSHFNPIFPFNYSTYCFSLLFACFANNKKIIEELLKHGANPQLAYDFCQMGAFPEDFTKYFLGLSEVKGFSETLDAKKYDPNPPKKYQESPLCSAILNKEDIKPLFSSKDSKVEINYPEKDTANVSAEIKSFDHWITENIQQFQMEQFFKEWFIRLRKPSKPFSIIRLSSTEKTIISPALLIACWLDQSANVNLLLEKDAHMEFALTLLNKGAILKKYHSLFQLHIKIRLLPKNKKLPEYTRNHLSFLITNAEKDGHVIDQAWKGLCNINTTEVKEIKSEEPPAPGPAPSAPPASGVDEKKSEPPKTPASQPAILEAKQSDSSAPPEGLVAAPGGPNLHPNNVMAMCVPATSQQPSAPSSTPATISASSEPAAEPVPSAPPAALVAAVDAEQRTSSATILAVVGQSDEKQTPPPATPAAPQPVAVTIKEAEGDAKKEPEPPAYDSENDTMEVEGSSAPAKIISDAEKIQRLFQKLTTITQRSTNISELFNLQRQAVAFQQTIIDRMQHVCEPPANSKKP